MKTSTIQTASRLANIGSNVFAEISNLALKYNAINLGQGFPNIGMSEFLKKYAVEAIMDNNLKMNSNQYTRPGGHPEFVQSLSDIYSPLYNKKLDPLNEIVTFTGAQEGIYAILTTFLEPGDEVILIEPYFDAYINISKLLDVKTIGIPLEFPTEIKKQYTNRETDTNQLFSSDDLKLDLSRLEKSINSKTKMIILNNPHNPTGKVFTKNELLQICEILKKYPNIIILSDEVYEYMCYDNKKHERIGTFSNINNQVISLFSSGKTFSCTGWRSGYAICDSSLQKSILKSHSCISFCGVTPLEIGLAKAFKHASTSGYFQSLQMDLQKRRDLLVETLNKINMRPILPKGGYFVCADISNLNCYNEFLKSSFYQMKNTSLDYAFAMYLCKEKKLAVVPTSPFYTTKNYSLGKTIVRLAYCKDNNTLNKAIEVLNNL